MAVFDCNHVVLDKDPVTGRFQLSSLISYEIIRLPMGTFELIFEEGQGFVYRLQDDDGDVVPVSQFFKRKVCFSDEEGYTIQWPNGEESKLKELKQMRQLRTLSLKLPPTNMLASFQVAIFSWPRVAGHRTFLCIGDLHRVFSFSQYKGKAADWVKHMYNSWYHLLYNKWELDGFDHMLKPKVVGGKPAQDPFGVPESAETQQKRTLPFYAASFHSVLCLLFGWSFRRVQDGGFSTPVDRDRAEMALHVLVSQVTDLHFTICNDEQVMWPYPRVARHFGFECLLWYKDEALDLAPLYEIAEAGDPMAGYAIEALQPCPHTRKCGSLMSVLMLLGHASQTVSQAPRAHELVKQLLRQIASSLDRAVANMKVMVTGQCMDDSKMVLSLASGVSHEAHMQETVCGYVVAAKAAVQKSWKQTPGLCLANDDSNVRTVELANTAIVLPNNVAFWAPVQATFVLLMQQWFVFLYMYCIHMHV